MNFQQATRSQLLEIAFYDDFAPLSIKAEALAELIRRKRIERAFDGLQIKIRRKRA